MPYYEKSPASISNFPQKPRPTGSPINRWMISVYETLTYLVRTTPARTVDTNNFHWMGQHNSTSSYAMGDIVSVETTGSFVSGSITYRKVPGIYLCVNPVKPKIDDLSGLDPDTLALVQESIRSSTTDMQEPVYPSAPLQYWQLISLLPQKVKVCVDNNTYVDYWVDMQKVDISDEVTPP